MIKPVGIVCINVFGELLIIETSRKEEYFHDSGFFLQFLS